MGTSELHLYSGAPFDPRYEHSIYWGHGELDRQTAYFDGLPGRSFADFRFIRKDQEININIPYDECVESGFNYCCIINSEPFKRWYYFITGKRYVSPSVTALTVELDVIQTYQFDWTIPACFVEREHPASDKIGDNLLTEGLELGEFVINNYLDFSAMDDLAIVCLSSVTMQNPMGEPVVGSMINNVYQGLKMYTRTANALGATVLNAALSSLSTQGKAEGVQAIWMYPKALITAEWDNEADEVMLEVKGMNMANFNFNRPANLDGYSPRNQKLLTYPYQYTYCHNNQGTAAVYQYEHFDNGSPTFRITGACSPDGVVRMCPTNHRGALVDNESGITLGAFPACSWTQDAYKIWMAQTAASQEVQMLGANLTVAAGGLQTGYGLGTALLSGGTSGGNNFFEGVHKVANGYLQARSILASREDKAVQPPQAKGQQSGSCNVAMQEQHFRFCSMSIKADQAKRLDQFFDMYGYQTNEVKTPELMSRSMWNFVKTVGCVILGGIDAEDRRRIGAIFDKGITFWHAPETMYRYDLAAGNLAKTR